MCVETTEHTACYMNSPQWIELICHLLQWPLEDSVDGVWSLWWVARSNIAIYNQAVSTDTRTHGPIVDQTWKLGGGGEDKLRCRVMACLEVSRWVLSGGGSGLYGQAVWGLIAHPHASRMSARTGHGGRA